jgi:hypothetical protein
MPLKRLAPCLHKQPRRCLGKNLDYTVTAARLLGLTFKRAIGPILVIVEDHCGVADDLLLLVFRDHTAPDFHLLVAEAVHGKYTDIHILIRRLKETAVLIGEGHVHSRTGEAE